ncbi:MAG TPA: hypothetical protein VK066_02120 [Chloroflexota bacterium]|nr:hypothetical protein [Chloroflexota bacterium]
MLQTADTCDQTGPKYYCAHVDYDNYGSYGQVYDRWYTGAIDGGAQYWHLWSLNDFWWNGSG